MSCPPMRQLLQAYHDGELDVSLARQVGEHLTDCPDCFAQARNLSTLRRALRNAALRFPVPTRLLRAAIRLVEQAERDPDKYYIVGWLDGRMILVAVRRSRAGNSGARQAPGSWR